MDKGLCKEIRYRVRQWVAPAIAEHPGVVELSRVYRIWGGEATQKELEECLDGLDALRLAIGGDTHYVFPDVVEKAFDRIENRIQELKEEIKEKELIRLRLETELEVLGDLQDVWNTDWNAAEQEDKISTDGILTFIATVFASKEKKLQSSIEKCREMIKDKKIDLKSSEPTRKILFSYYSVLPNGRPR